MALRTPSLFPGDPAPTPSAPAILAHCDGGARGNPGPAGYGAEITDTDGNVLAELSEFLGIRTNNFAEYAGLLATLQYALDHGHPSLRVVSDSLLMVKQIQGAYKVKSPDLLPLFQEARRRIAKLDRFEITHALRHKNKAADRLANDAMDRGMKRGTPAEGRPLVARPDASLARQGGVQSLPLRAIPYPSQAPPAPAAPVLLDPAAQTSHPPSPSSVAAAAPASSTPAEKPAPQTTSRPTPTRATHAPIILAPEPTRPVTPPKPASPTADTKPSPPAMLRGFTRNGAVHLLGPDKLPDGIFVKIIPE